MVDLNVTRAWKDAEYRQSLSDAERSLIPTHPSGWAAEDLEEVVASSSDGDGPIYTITRVFIGIFFPQ